MPVFPQEGRLDELRRLGISEPVVRLAAGEVIQPVFDPRFVGPPGYVYGWGDDEIVPGPDGPMLVPLWDFADGVQGVWEVDGGLEFIDYSIEAEADDYEVVARTEQGFLAWMFMTLHADLFDEEEEFATLPDAAEVVGFCHYAEWLDAFETMHVSSDDEWDKFQVDFVERIDRLKTSRDRRPR
jgi:hypothetical protein